MGTGRPVVVVGGGIAGLTTARLLEDRGIAAVVYEATPHVGGRIDSVHDQGILETGMQFYYSSYTGAFELLRRYGLTDQLHPIHVRGQMCFEGRVTTFDKSWPWLSLLSGADNLRLQALVARQVWPLMKLDLFDYRADDPLDQVDAAAYFLEHGGPSVLELAARPMVTSYAFTEPEGHSLAVLLRILRLGAFSKMYGLTGGNDSLPRRMAEELSVVHDKVDEIVVEDGVVRGVRVDGEAIEADHVVCAVRGSQAGRLLPGVPGLSEAFDTLTYSNIVLVNLHLDTTLTGPDWTYVMSRVDGHRSAFGVDLLRRSPAMFPDGRSVLQVVFADPVAGEILGDSDEEICRQAAKDMETFLPGVSEQVRATSVVRRVRALPNFGVGMFGRVRGIQQRVAREVEGLHLAGDYLRAPLCEGAVQSAHDAAESVASADQAVDAAAA